MTSPSDTLPGVPVGLATKIGLAAGAIGALAAAVTAILNGDHSDETIGAGLFAAVNLYAVIRGRMDQAAAARAAARPAQPMTPNLPAVGYSTADVAGDYNRKPRPWEASGPYVSDAGGGGGAAGPSLTVDVDEPGLTDEDLAGRDLDAEPVGHGDADLSDGDTQEEGIVHA